MLVVAHSQGNFHANKAISTAKFYMHWIKDQESVRLVSVATPASKVENNGSYVSLHSDGVIKYIPLALKPNVHNSVPKPGKFDHEFVKHRMSKYMHKYKCWNANI